MNHTFSSLTDVRRQMICGEVYDRPEEGCREQWIDTLQVFEQGSDQPGVKMS